MNLSETLNNMCLAFVYIVDKYNKKTKKANVSLEDIHKEVINPYKLEIKKGDLVKIQMGVILEVVDETSY